MTAGPTCPACHVAVLPGYTKCPKCHGLLPYAKRPRSATMGDAGGTVAEDKSSPLVPIVVAMLVAGGIIAFFGLRGGGGSSEETRPVSPPVALAPQPPAPTLTTPLAQAQPLIPRDTPRARPNQAVTQLEQALKKQRLWSTVVVVDDRVDLRSATCADPAMGPTIEAARAGLRGAGMVRLRCLEESGAVVFDRNL